MKSSLFPSPRTDAGSGDHRRWHPDSAGLRGGRTKKTNCEVTIMIYLFHQTGGTLWNRKITVIVPVYNVEKYLPECLDSLAGQTYKNLQVLVVNDGSTDSSPQIIEDYVRRFPDRFAQLNKPNGGLSDARNFAIGKAEGEWIAFLDSDDWADPEYYAKMAEVMVRGADVVVQRYRIFL